MVIKSKKLIISPHIDDDVLGCGGIMDENTLVLYCGIELQKKPKYGHANRETRLDEAKQLQKFLGHSVKYIHETEVNYYKLQDLTEPITETINKYEPDEIYIPFPSYNQDHKTTHQASLIALRQHDINFLVKKVFVYEEPDMFFWNNEREFKPTYFKKINIDRKIIAYKLLVSQVRNFRSPDALKAMAFVRGQQSGFEHAEAFEILRYID